MAETRCKFNIGDVVRHRAYPFRGVVFQVDPEFEGSDAWLQAIPAEIRPARNQPFYYLYADSWGETKAPVVFHVVCIAEENLLPDQTGMPVLNPEVAFWFGEMKDGHYTKKPRWKNWWPKSEAHG